MVFIEIGQITGGRLCGSRIRRRTRYYQEQSLFSHSIVTVGKISCGGSEVPKDIDLAVHMYSNKQYSISSATIAAV